MNGLTKIESLEKEVSNLRVALVHAHQESARLKCRVIDLEAALRRCRCIYCGNEFPFEEKDKLADHIMACEKSPMVQMVKAMESRITDYMDLMNDEFLRINSLTKDTEIIGICQRSMMVIAQKEPVIKQRDDSINRLHALESLLRRAHPNMHTDETGQWFTDRDAVLGPLLKEGGK